MKITELSVKRPTTILMIMTLIIGLGIYGYNSLGADLLPSTNTPIISVSVTDTGADATEIEDNILKPLEDSVSSLGGIDNIRSTALNGYGYSIITFDLDIKANDAFMDVQQAVAVTKLPDNSSKPTIRKYNINSNPVIKISLTGKVSDDELFSSAKDLKTSLEKLTGVGNITIIGDSKKELSVNVDKNALSFYNLGINAIVNKIMMENMTVPVGQIKQPTQNQNVKVTGKFNNLDDIENLNIYKQNTKDIKLKDISDIKLKYSEPDSRIRLNKVKSVGVFVQKQSDSNIIEVTNRIKTQLKLYKTKALENIKVSIVDDQSKFINNTLEGVKKNLLEGILITSFVMFIFLRMLRPSLIVIISIPTSLIATFFMINILGFTLNILSMLALSSCIGILVDDSIVVLENIQRHLKMNKDPISAAIDGRKEIGMAAIAITLCDVVVFAPVAFMTDMIGQFFREFGITVVCATLFSLVISFTVTPMLAAKLLTNKNIEKQSKKDKKLIKIPSFGFLLKIYEKMLLWSLNHRLIIISIVLLAFLLSGLTIPMKIVKTEFLPTTDQSNFTIDVSLPSGANLDQTDKKIQIIENHLKKLDEVDKFYSMVGDGKISHKGSIIVILKEKSKRKISQSKSANEFRKWSKSLKGAEIETTEASIVGRTSVDGSKPIFVNISGPNKDNLRKYAKDIEKIVGSVSGTTDVENSDKYSEKELNIKINRTTSAENGFSTSDVSSFLRTSINGTNAGVYRKDGSDYDIIVKNKIEQIKTKDDIENLKITNSYGRQVDLKKIVDINYNDSSQEISRINKKLLISISANIQGRSLGDITDEIKSKILDLKLPNDYNVEFGGEQKNMATSFDSLIKVIIVSIFLVYMILVILYESFFTPFIRMLSLPCGLIGSILGLIITGNALNLVTMIGIVMMDGLVSKNGTLLIDYTNTLMKQGMDLKTALIKAGTTRLKPIMMTSITMIFGMLPTALALGEGSEIKSGIGVVLIGGMITSTFFTPILLPVVYTIMNDLMLKFRLPKKQFLIKSKVR